jgi:UDP-N-acetylenolpyruvoylglucosamine reductase
MGLGPLAIYLAHLGFEVTGEDDALTEEMRLSLTRGGVTLGAISPECELVAYSSAISRNHPAFRYAEERKLPLAQRGRLLAEVVRDRKLVAVCGSHGKTTTAAMVVTALLRSNFPAGYVLGGLFGDDTPPARSGSNDWVVAEIDESDGTIGHFSPEITVAVNLDWDHPDFYPKLADLEAVFAALFGRTRGSVLISDACPLSARVAAQQPCQWATFGRAGEWRGEIAEESADGMTLRLGGKFGAAEAVVRARGDFNASNAIAGLAAVRLMGAEFTARSLANYPAVRRRQAVLHGGDGITVMEDYAHHPAEIRALLGSLRRRLAVDGRLVVIFQPHRFSRTAQFKMEFAAALATADRVHLLDVYAAGEAPMAGGTTADIAAELRKIAPAASVSYLPGAAFYDALSRDVRGGDLVAFVGAGDIERKAREWLDLFHAKVARGKEWDANAARWRALVSADTKVRREEPLAAKTTMRVGGAARVYAEPANRSDLQALLKAARAAGIAAHFLGRGSNLIVPDEGVDGLVISLAHESWASFAPRPDGRVAVGAGLRLKNLCGLAARAGLVGFEFLEGIPGSVGGALRMNAGAMGGWIFDVVEEVELMSLDGEIAVLPKSAMRVDYRHCAELREAVALGAVLRPAAESAADGIKRQMDAYARKRHESQPREPSAGCIFKNPTGTSAGRLIDECGLKGERVGDAEVSPVHANFIVNRGAATSAEVLELVRRVRARVREVKDVDLEPEVLLYGKQWKDVL